MREFKGELTPEMRFTLGGIRLLGNFLVDKLAEADPGFRAVIERAGQAGLPLDRGDLSEDSLAANRKALEELRARLESTPSWQSIDERQEGRSEVVREVARGGAN